MAGARFVGAITTATKQIIGIQYPATSTKISSGCRFKWVYKRFLDSYTCRASVASRETAIAMVGR